MRQQFATFFKAARPFFRAARPFSREAWPFCSAARPFLLSAALSCSALAAGAGIDTGPRPAADVEDITVTGRRPEGISPQQFMVDFVAEVGDPVSANRGFARWQHRVCVGVTNLDNAQYAQYIADRISTLAAELGLKPGEPGCAPNIHILFTHDGAAQAAALVAAQPRAFRPWSGTGGTSQGRQALERFTGAATPVRWWQVTLVVNRAGGIAIELPNAVEMPLGAGSADLSIPAPSVSALAMVPWIAGSGSRITNSVSDVLDSAYAIVDLSKLGATTVQQLSDYLAMVLLSQVSPERTPSGYASILNLFTARSPAAGLTDMDLTYLRALYAMDTLRMPQLQRSLLAHTMVRVQDAMAETTSMED